MGSGITFTAGALVEHLAVVCDQYRLAGNAVALAVALQLGVELSGERVGTSRAEAGGIANSVQSSAAASVRYIAVIHQR